MWRRRPAASLRSGLSQCVAVPALSAIKSAVRIGQAQIGETLISLHDNEDPIFGIDVVPFLATSYDEARKLWAASKPADRAEVRGAGSDGAVRRAVAAAGHLCEEGDQ